MIRVIEKEHLNRSKYEVFLDNIKIKDIYIRRMKRTRHDYGYLFLIDSNGKNIEEVFIYLNYKSDIKSLNAREQSQSALRLLYTFKEIINKDFSEFSENDIKNLSDFILGISIKGNYLEIRNLSSRSISTHNVYFDAIRRFLLYMRIENQFFFEKIDASNKYIKHGNIQGYRKKAKYKINLNRHSSFFNKAPKYISVDEYKNIINYLSKETSGENIKRDRIMIDLMFLFGLRIGEVLGLTIEDIKENKIILRNRISDREDQKAKTCFTPRSRIDYKIKIYNLKDRGSQEVFLVPKTIEKINEYIEESRDIFSISEVKLNNILNKSRADSVEGNRENYYIFLNKNGSPISANGWSKRLKKIYLECGISIDSDNKKINLSHRLRHGYAMYLRKIGKDPLFIKIKLRHASLSSTEKYYNPTEEDIIEENRGIIKSIEKIIMGD